MQLYEIRYPELDCFVKFKALLPPEVDDFHAVMGDTDSDEWIQAVLNHFIYNINTDVKPQLKLLSVEAAKKTIQALYKGCVSLNPGLCLEDWVSSSYLTLSSEKTLKGAVNEVKPAKRKIKPIARAKILSFNEIMKKKIVGQDDAVDVVFRSLKRTATGLGEPDKPLGVFLFAGASGVGKTHFAKVLHQYLFGSKHEMARIDCGEFQEKHQALTLLGAPPSYVGYDDEKGGTLSQMLEKNNQTVILLDEVEKAHESLWNVFLRLFDEGKITDSRGVVLDFSNCLLIMTTNLGNDKITKELTGKSAGFGARIETQMHTQVLPKRSMVISETTQAIKDYFKPEFLNRIGNIVIFNHLTTGQYREIAHLELEHTIKKLSKVGIQADFDDSVIEGLVSEGVDTIQGARGMAKVRRDSIENLMADKILDYNLKKGAKLSVSYDKEFKIDVKKQKTTTRKKVTNARR